MAPLAAYRYGAFSCSAHFICIAYLKISQAACITLANAITTAPDFLEDVSGNVRILPPVCVDDGDAATGPSGRRQKYVGSDYRKWNRRRAELGRGQRLIERRFPVSAFAFAQKPIFSNRLAALCCD